MRIGIDVGGTNTDAVLMDGSQIVGSCKVPTTKNVTDGIADSICTLFQQTSAAPQSVESTVIGTTHFINSLVEANNLAGTAVIRLGLPATAGIPPLAGWPERLTTAMQARTFLCQGGHEIDGRPISKVVPSEIREAAEIAAQQGISSFALSSVYSPVSNDAELEARRTILEVLPNARVTMSHEVGRIGLLERENATAINAAMADLATSICAGLQDAVSSAGVVAPLFLSQNDGTLMTVARAADFPVLTFASGPTNSMRGAAFLSGLQECAVVDVGGTTSDFGIIHNGFPREASTAVDVSGVRTNFRMPDVIAIGIGGGSVVTDDGQVGPSSVGYELTRKGLVFGGATRTSSDIATASGLTSLGDPSLVKHISKELSTRAFAYIRTQMGDALDRLRTDSQPLPLVAVGGGSFLVPDDIPGVSMMARPSHSGVANAIGAATAQVGGEIDKMYSIAPGTRDSVIDNAKNEAVERAVSAGADPKSVRIVEVDEVPLAYLPGNATRVRIKAVGDTMVGTQR
ncbi:hydantoinase/oxoprolinase family protein [Gordonia westfalica]|uniref:Hydantoinase/oxoprolinase family protein n=1 Tax=Gordonia westfalica TaxID=158898 RepID=A0ABU2H157_9ACTN|nr:hydantoinase/oxoprolinase family protein [Gordonia westfalica]MDS1116744.1 hydantoinase/oxoprolinase family protein [Gordonia westfalica]